jgi:hypothetical protein
LGGFHAACLYRQHFDRIKAQAAGTFEITNRLTNAGAILLLRGDIGICRR